MTTKSGWAVGFFSNSVYRDMQKLPESVQEEFDAVRKKIEDEGPHRVPSHYKKHLKGEDGLWELRLRRRGTNVRAIYVKQVRKRLIILVVFEKKSQGIPKHILQLARQRAKQV